MKVFKKVKVIKGIHSVEGVDYLLGDKETYDLFSERNLKFKMRVGLNSEGYVHAIQILHQAAFYNQRTLEIPGEYMVIKSRNFPQIHTETNEVFIRGAETGRDEDMVFIGWDKEPVTEDVTVFKVGSYAKLLGSPWRSVACKLERGLVKGINPFYNFCTERAWDYRVFSLVGKLR